MGCVSTFLPWFATISIFVFAFLDGNFDDFESRQFRLSRDNSTRKYSVIIGIKSGVKYAERREVWRSSKCPQIYKKAGWEYKFILGLPSSAGQNLTRHRQGAVATREESIDADNLLKEMEQYGDLQFVAMRDEYMDLTIKTFQWLRHSFATSSAEYFIMHDDDFCASPDFLNTRLDRYYDFLDNGQATIENEHGVRWQHLAPNSNIPDIPENGFPNSSFRLQSLTDTRPIFGVRPHEFQNTHHLLWFGGYIFAGTEYESMRGRSNTTCPFFSGARGSLMNRALVSYLVEHEWVQTLFFLRYGSASEDANLGKAIAKLMIKHGVRHNLSLVIGASKQYSFKLIYL